MIKRPNPFLWLPLAGLLKISARFQGNRLENKIKIEKPAIILSNHASFRDYVFVTAALYPKRINYLAAAKMFYEPERRPFLKLARAIPICSFQGDLRAVSNAMHILKSGGLIGIFPEGQISYHGASLKPPFSIAKLIKKAKVNVYLVKNKNAYLMSPPWSKNVFKGNVYTRMHHLFTPEQLEKISESEIYNSVSKSLYFDAGAFNKEQKHRYKVRDIFNLENLIYQCPNCGFEGLESHFDRLVCPECHHELVYDQFGLLDQQSVFAHYERQRIALESLIADDNSYTITTSVRLVRYQGNNLVEVGHGRLTLNRDEYIYEGSDKDQNVLYRFATKSIQYLPVDIGADVQIYDNYEVYQFYMDTKYLPIKFSTAGEFFYRLKNEKPVEKH